MDFMNINGAEIAFRVKGSGPPLLAPECNYSWSSELVELMARRFTVIIASPRDFGTSTRTRGPYKPDCWATDLRHVALSLGFPRFLFFGYSFTGAFGPWLAQRLAKHGSVVAVASGGFPLLGDYGITSCDVDTQMTEMEQDEDTWAQVDQRFDPLAGAIFYRDLAKLAPNSLVDGAPGPLYCFWGDQDQDAVGMVLPHHELAEGLSQRGVPWKQYPGYDHEGLNSALQVAWPDVETWLLEQAREQGL
ncbi:alpha/beta fold hydrolase [Glutamicibacter ardleyensis]